jgi:hypothetical protein
MTELCEMVAIGMVTEKDVECPFHDEHKCEESLKNNFEGNADTLGNNLAVVEDNSSTVLRKNGPKSTEQSDDPDKTPVENREINILKGNDDCIYPVAFSAHHLIPAKESLQRAKDLHAFMEKKDKFCCNLGYDVNGNENGVWLPGLHAVNRKGVNLWGAASTDLLEEEEIGRKVVVRPDKEDKSKNWTYSPLDGPKPSDNPTEAFYPTNMKWLYIQKAMTFLKPIRQFHDRHPIYSEQVENHLNAVADVLKQLYDRRKKKGKLGCSKCREREKEKKPSPPIALLKLLNNTSRFYRDEKLLKHTQDNEFFTSSWCGPDAPRKLSDK